MTRLVLFSIMMSLYTRSTRNWTTTPCSWLYSKISIWSSNIEIYEIFRGMADNSCTFICEYYINYDPKAYTILWSDLKLRLRRKLPQFFDICTSHTSTVPQCAHTILVDKKELNSKCSEIFYIFSTVQLITTCFNLRCTNWKSGWQFIIPKS